MRRNQEIVPDFKAMKSCTVQSQETALPVRVEVNEASMPGTRSLSGFKESERVLKMNEETRTLSVSIEGVYQMDELKLNWAKAVDDVFMKNVENVNFVSPEVEGIAPGHIEVEVIGDPEAMKIEAKWFLSSTFDNVQIHITPTEEEIEEVKQNVEDYIDSLEASEINPEDHKVKGEI